MTIADSMTNLRIPLKVVFYRDDNEWVAHCLEFDLMGDGTTKKNALDALTNAITMQVQASVEQKNLKNLFTPADGKFFAMFAAGQDVAVGELHFQIDSVQINDVQTREYLPSEADAICV